MYSISSKHCLPVLSSLHLHVPTSGTHVTVIEAMRGFYITSLVKKKRKKKEEDDIELFVCWGTHLKGGKVGIERIVSYFEGFS